MRCQVERTRLVEREPQRLLGGEEDHALAAALGAPAGRAVVVAGVIEPPLDVPREAPRAREVGGDEAAVVVGPEVGGL
jgi:hypothetical protein